MNIPSYGSESQNPIKSSWASRRPCQKVTAKAKLPWSFSPTLHTLCLTSSCTLACGHSSSCVHAPTVWPTNSYSGRLSGLGVYTAVVQSIFPSKDLGGAGIVTGPWWQLRAIGTRDSGMGGDKDFRLAHRGLCTPKPVRRGMAKGAL